MLNGPSSPSAKHLYQFVFAALAIPASVVYTKGYIWELENKNPPRPSAEKLAAIASALDTTVDVLIGTPINTEDELSQADKVFFRKFVKLPEHRQDDIRKMLGLWDDE